MAALPVVDALSEVSNLLVMLLEKCAGNVRLPAPGHKALFLVSCRRHKGVLCHYIILDNGILKSNSSIFPRSEVYITQ